MKLKKKNSKPRIIGINPVTTDFEQWSLVEAAEKCRKLFKQSKNQQAQDFYMVLEQGLMAIHSKLHSINEMEKKIAYLIKKDLEK